MKKGFTLIELLAVIVILAIIALIATPIVLSIIEETKESAVLRSAEHYLSSIELSIAKKNLSAGGSFSPNVCEIQNDGNLLCDGKDTLEVELSGEVPKSGTITFNKGKITDINLTLSNKRIVKDENGKLVYQETPTFEKVKLCTANTTKAKGLVWQRNGDPTNETSYAEEDVGLLASDGDAYAAGVTYTCNFGETEDAKNLLFFVLSSTETDVTLIAGVGLGGTVAWCGDETQCKTGANWDNTKGAITANDALVDRTSNWSSANGGKLNDAQMSTIKLPTKDQIESVYEGTMPTWLYSFIKKPISYGYWTVSVPDDDPIYAWQVTHAGNFAYFGCTIGASDSLYIRPVITLSKSNI